GSPRSPASRHDVGQSGQRRTRGTGGGGNLFSRHKQSGAAGTVCRVSVAVVTGAGRGIGRAIARRLEADGHKVVGVDKQAGEGVDEVADVSDAAAVKAVAERIGPVGVLINNAGIWLFSSLLDMPPEDALAV